ncbi:MAG: PAS domain-containing protein [Alphaproteobacteria bacterium]|nr:PAS domain-containing protein [Alphaproteobacteria bacterium]
MPKSRHQTIIPLEMVQRVRANRNYDGGSRPASIADKIHKLISHMSFDENVPLYISTISGELVYVNEGYRTLVAVCEYTGKTPAGPVDSRHLPPSLMAVLHEVQLTRQNVSVEETIKMHGVFRQYRSRHFPVCDDDGAVIAVGGTYVDYTDKIQMLGQENLMQQRFRDFARATSDWYWEVDRNYNITFVSDRLMAITGKPGILMKGKRFEDFGELKSGLNGHNLVCEHFLDAMKPFRDQLFLIKNSEGDRIYNHLSGVPVFDSASGEFMGYRGAGTDVTLNYRSQRDTLAAQKSLEHTLEELTNKNIQLDMASAESEAALGAKSEFLAAMSHELRTPLNAIIGFAEAMKMEVHGSLNDQYISYSKDIMSAGHHLLDLINDVLDVAVLESGKIKLDLEEVSLQSVVDKAVNLIVMRANQKYLDISAVRLSGDFCIYADERRAVQIFVNLLSNAVKFTPEKGRIGLRINSNDPAVIAVTIWDTGIGIPADQHQLVFEKFHQARDNIYSRKAEGTGLGLHISQHLARLMGGDITLKSVAGEGSEFTVTFPLRPGH